MLDRATALVSPQFHISFDPGFQTVTNDDLDTQWQTKAGFVSQRERRAPKPTTMTETSNNPNKRSSSNSEGVETPKPKRSRFGNIDTVPQRDINVSLQKQNDSNQPKDSMLQQTHIDSPIKEREPVEVLIEAMMAENQETTKQDVEGEIFCIEAMFPHKEDENHPLLAFKATSDPDTMYLHEAMKEPDKKEFLTAMQKEVTDQAENGNFSIIHKSKVPKKATILPTVWQMKRKRNIRTWEVKKYKARLNVDGSHMQKGIHYDETYAPVVKWNSLRLILTLSALYNWHTVKLDYVLAYPQAPVEKELYMKIPKGFEIDEGKTEDYILDIHRNIYGQKQAGRVWNKYLTNKLINNLGFVQSKIDECVFYRGQTMYALYTDDSILAGPSKTEIEQVIKDLKKTKLDLTEEGNLEDFLGVQIERRPDGTVHLSQPHLIDQIIKDLRLDKEGVTTKDVPASSSRILLRHSSSEDFDNSFNYKSVIGKLNYLEKTTRSDISYITHQCARFTSCPKKEHGQAVKWLGRYLKATRKKGTILKPVKGKGLEVHVDADFSGNWDPKESWDRDTARSRHGYIVKYEGCPLLWKSQLQTEIALSSTEREYTGMSYGLREVIPVIEILKEMKQFGFPIQKEVPKVYCKVFEDNSGALEMAATHKYRPRTKHLNVKLHHFRDYVTRGEISIHPIDSAMQQADYLTKPVNYETLSRLRQLVMGW